MTRYPPVALALITLRNHGLTPVTRAKLRAARVALPELRAELTVVAVYYGWMEAPPELRRVYPGCDK